jgi:hypothetical protein
MNIGLSPWPERVQGPGGAVSIAYRWRFESVRSTAGMC